MDYNEEFRKFKPAKTNPNSSSFMSSHGASWYISNNLDFIKQQTPISSSPTMKSLVFSESKSDTDMLSEF